MATSIYTGSASPGAAATGRPCQGHVQYAQHQGAWWVFYLTSTQSLSASYSTNGTTWNTPTGSPFSLVKVHNSEGRNFGFSYKLNGTTDVLHMAAAYQDGSNVYPYHSRFTLGTTWSNTNVELNISPNNTFPPGVTVAGPATTFDSTGLPIDTNGYFYSTTYGTGNLIAAMGTPVDTSSTWTSPSFTEGDQQTTYAATNSITSTAVFNLGGVSTSQLLAISDNCNTSTLTNGSSTMTNLEAGKYTTVGNWVSAATVFTTLTQTDANAWGACARTTGEVHAFVLSNNSNTYLHSVYTGSWATATAPGTLTYTANSGIAAVSDGTNEWIFVNSAGNIEYNKWNGSTWGGWTVLESSRTNTPAYLSACYSSAANAIQVIWTEKNGSNYEIWTSQLSLSGGSTVSEPGSVTSSSTVTGVGFSFYAEPGSVTSSSVASGTGTELFNSIGSITSNSTFSGVTLVSGTTKLIIGNLYITGGLGLSQATTVAEPGSITSGSVASGTGTKLFNSVGSVTSGSVASGTGAELFNSVGTITSGSVASGIFVSIGSVTSGSVASGTGAELFNSVGIITSGSVASGTGTELFNSIGNVTSNSVASGTGAELFNSIGSVTSNSIIYGQSNAAVVNTHITSNSVASGIGSSLFNSIGTITSNSVILAAPYYVANIISNSVATGIFASIGSITSGSVASGTGSALFISTGNITSGSVALGTGTELFASIGSITSGSVASGTGTELFASIGSITSGSVASGTGTELFVSIGSVTSGSVASGTGAELFNSVGSVTSGSVALGIFNSVGTIISGSTASGGGASLALDTYYISASGNNSTGTGTSLSPWATFSHGIISSSAGSTLLGNGGDTITDNIVLTSTTGAYNFGSYGTGQCTISGGTNPAIKFTNISGIIINNLILTQSTATNQNNVNPTGVVEGICTTSTRYTAGITVSNCTITGGNSGITFNAPSSSTGGYNGITLSNNIIHDSLENGICIYEAGGTANNIHYSNVTINGNTIYNIPGDANSTDNVGNGISLDTADNTAGALIVSNNWIYNCGYDATGNPSGPGGIVFWYVTGGVMSGNVVHDIYQMGGEDGCGMDIDESCFNCIMEYNYSYHNQGAGYYLYGSGTGNTVRFNISVNDMTTGTSSNYGCLSAIGQGSPAYVYNNTIICWTSAIPAAYLDTTAGLVLYNNIFASLSGAPSVKIIGTKGAGFDLQGNEYQAGNGAFNCSYNGSTSTSLAAWRTATGLENSHGFSDATLFSTSGTAAALTPSQLNATGLAPYVVSGVLANTGLNLNSLYSISVGTQDITGAQLLIPYSVGAITNGIVGSIISNSTPLATPYYQGSVTSGSVASGIFNSVGSIISGSVASGTGAELFNSIGTITSGSVASGTGAELFVSIGSIISGSVASGTGAELFNSIGTITSGSVASGTGAELFVSIGSVTSNSVVLAAPYYVANIISNSIASGTGAELFVSIGSVTSNSIASGTGSALFISIGNVTSNSIIYGQSNAAVVNAQITSGSVTSGTGAELFNSIGSVTSNSVVTNITVFKRLLESYSSRLLESNAHRDLEYNASVELFNSIGNVTSGSVASGIFANVGSVTSSSVASGTGAELFNSIGSRTSSSIVLAAPYYVANITSNSIVSGIFASVGSISSGSVASGTGAELFVSIGSISSGSVASGTGSVLFTSVGSITSSSVASGTGAELFVSIGSITSSSVASGTGAELFNSIGSRTSSSIVLAAPYYVANITSNSIVSGVGAELFNSVGSIESDSVASGIGSSLSTSIGNVTSDSIVYALSQVGLVTVYITSSSVASGTGAELFVSIGSISSGSVASGTGTELFNSTGIITSNSIVLAAPYYEADIISSSVALGIGSLLSINIGTIESDSIVHATSEVGLITANVISDSIVSGIGSSLSISVGTITNNSVVLAAPYYVANVISDSVVSAVSIKGLATATATSDSTVSGVGSALFNTTGNILSQSIVSGISPLITPLSLLNINFIGGGYPLIYKIKKSWDIQPSRTFNNYSIEPFPILITTSSSTIIGNSESLVNVTGDILSYSTASGRYVDIITGDISSYSTLLGSPFVPSPLNINFVGGGYALK